ncbi:MAG: ATP-dependent helicase [Planctomycetaceae bacterium]
MASTLDTILSELNDQQRSAATHGSDPLLIVAGAGTGKTTTLAHRVASLIVNGTDPRRILLLTFTRRAAAEMMRRVDAILYRLAQAELDSPKPGKRTATRGVVSGTFHAVATRMLREHGPLIGLRPEFTILDRSDSEDLLNVVRSELELPDSATRFPLKGTCLDIYSRSVNTQRKASEVIEAWFPWVFEHEASLRDLFKKYVDRKQANNVLDYDDLLLFWRALVQDERAGKKLREQFDCVLVDEYQDTNVLQADILKAFSPNGRGVTVVGDDAQSIYSFRAATIRNILDFPQQFENTEVIRLEQNYRSSQPILTVTNLVIAESAERHRKDLWSAREGGEKPQLITCADENDQTDFIIDEILNQRERGIQLREQAILFRASHHSLALELELTHRNIPFHKYGGLKFVETAHVKDLTSFLRLAENPTDIVAGMRVLVLIPGIGRKKAMQLMNRLREAGGHFDSWSGFSTAGLDKDAFEKATKLMVGLANTRDHESNLQNDISAIRKFYEPLLESRYDHAESRLNDIRQLEFVSARYEDRLTFLTEMALDPPSSTQDFSNDASLDDDYLILSTIHSAKGLEWDTVFVIHAADGNIPSDMATRRPAEIEEERRLFYVALTRAKNRLVVTHPERYYFPGRKRDAHSYSQLTRFLPRKIQKECERRVAMVAQYEREANESNPEDASAVRQQLKDLWAE